MASKAVTVSKWLRPQEDAADITVWPVGHNSVNHPDLAGRVCIAAYIGAATLSLHPTVAEARALIAALEWALEPQEVEA